MGLLERFRTQPKWKHADPAVRLDGVREIENDDELLQLAKDDPDARVRRAAIARAARPTALADIVRNDTDDGVRSAATERLVALASGGDEEASRAAVQNLAALGRTRELAAIARDGAHEATRTRAVEAVADQRTLGSVARHAAEPATRLLAMARLTEPSELEAVAMRSDHADSALAALEKLPEPSPDVLNAIAQRARSKAAQKRARSLLRHRERAQETVVPAAPATTYREADQVRARALTDQMSALASASDASGIRATYAALRVAWVELLADADIQPDIVERFEALSETARQRLAAHAEAARRAEALEREQAERVAVAAEVEALGADATPERLADARARWDQLPPMPESWAAELQRRFDEAVRSAERRVARREQLREQGERVPLLVNEVESLANTEDYQTVRARWQGARRQWQSIEHEIEIDPSLRDRYLAAAHQLESREQDLRAQRGREQQENLVRMQALVQRLETRGASELQSLRDVDQLLKDVKLAIGTMGPLPTRQDRDDLTVRLQAVRTAIQPRLQELREAEGWKRWANVQVQEELCAKMEALAATAESNPEQAVTAMRALQGQWKQVAAAPRSQAEGLWTRFKAAQDQVYEKTKDFFAQQAVERQENLAKKEAICARAEALSDSTDWIRTADAIKALQAEWKAVGPVTRGSEKAVWERFRAACDRFFTRRHEDLKKRKQDWSQNLARKEALIQEAEQLATSTDWERAAARIRQLQGEWKQIGPVRKNKSEVVWQRFRTASDTFFERFKTRDQEAVTGKVADREAAIAELEALVPAADAPADSVAPDDLYSKVQAARARWLQGPELPRAALQPLAERVNAALLSLARRWPEPFRGTELDPDLTRRKMEKLVAKVESLLPEQGTRGEIPGELSPAEQLARQWREALAANTMGVAATRQAEDARQRLAEGEVRSAQVAWSRLGPVTDAERRPLQERFDRAVRRFFEQKRRQMARA